MRLGATAVAEHESEDMSTSGEEELETLITTEDKAGIQVSGDEEAAGKEVHTDCEEAGRVTRQAKESDTAATKTPGLAEGGGTLAEDGGATDERWQEHG